jgi:hypothetical protein
MTSLAKNNLLQCAVEGDILWVDLYEVDAIRIATSTDLRFFIQGQWISAQVDADRLQLVIGWWQASRESDGDGMESLAKELYEVLKERFNA